jgi:hypothetical protein
LPNLGKARATTSQIIAGGKAANQIRVYSRCAARYGFRAWNAALWKGARNAGVGRRRQMRRRYWRSPGGRLAAAPQIAHFPRCPMKRLPDFIFEKAALT